MIVFKEDVFHCKKDIRYVFEKSSANSKYLMIIFSAFSPLGSPPHYSYISIFRNINFNRLFILDNYGPRGCFYLGNNKNFYVEYAVCKLIQHILSTYNILPENVICCGSSKGGYCALYFGMKYNFGYIISGAPVSLIGTYLKSQCTDTIDTAEFIAGGTSEEDIFFLDSLLFNIIKNCTFSSKIYIHAGKDDFIYKHHVTKILKAFNKELIPYELDLGNYSLHDDTGIYYPPYVSKVISNLVLNS